MNKERDYELRHDDLRSVCDLSGFDFQTTDDITAEEKIIGQERALKAIDFGLHIKNEGFNLYLSGIGGIGRNTTILQAVQKKAALEPPPPDICYIYNFQNKDEPRALQLPPGTGCQLKKDLEELIKDIEQQIIKAFMSEQYEQHQRSIIDKFEEKKVNLNAETQDFAKAKGMAVQQTLTGFVVVPLYKGGLLSDEEYEKLTKEKKDKLKIAQSEVYAKLEENLRKTASLNRDLKNEIKKSNEEVVAYAIGHLVEELKKKYSRYELIIKHLSDIQEDILKNIDVFRKESDSQLPSFPVERAVKEELFNKYRVNLLVDNCDAEHAPVVVEHNPTYYNLIGYAEYRAQFGALMTDFTMIKAGAVHKASGGYLILQAEQLLRDYFSWDSLKKVIRYKKAKIEDPYVRYGFAPTSGLRPEAVPVDLKVIIVGNPLIYHLLYIHDEEFKKLFKVKADFDSSSRKSDALIGDYVKFVANKAREENLMPFQKSAVAGIIDYSCRLVAHKSKLSAKFLEIVDIMREADSWARKEGGSFVEAKHIKEALESKIYRSNMIQEKIQESIKEGIIFIETDGLEVGQINGIAVLDLGDYMFGNPSRITVRTFVGRGSIINIERETKLSGKIHSKGILILSGYLGEKFAQDKPLALSASICFEQLYEEIEGDSASSAELYCLLSRLANVPLRQDIAVTGSVDQRGRIQPVGGINEKIEGFLEVCKMRGLSGKQGVIIPRANLLHLMLKDDVVNAVRESKFHIYAVETIDEGIEILTGVKAGVLQPDGSYPKDSLNYKVNERLNEYADIAVNFGKMGNNNHNSKKVKG